MSMLCESSSPRWDMTSAGTWLITNCGIVDVRDDVDELARDLVGDRPARREPRIADAGADRIAARVVALHRDLGANARLARRRQDLDEIRLRTRDLELEELDQELGRVGGGTVRAARLGAHLLRKGLAAVMGLACSLGVLSADFLFM